MMDTPGQFERQRLRSIVEKGRLYASERRTVCAEVRARIRDAEVVEVEGLGELFKATPPSPLSPMGRIEYDPSLIARLAVDHVYPEWVVSAQLELQIRSRQEEWHSREGKRDGASDVDPSVNAAA